MEPETVPPIHSLDHTARQELAACVDAHWGCVFGLLYRLARDPHEAEDLTQETFLRASQRRDSFVAGTNLRAWLMRIATNAFLDGRRRRQVARSTPLCEEAGLSHPARGPVQRVENQELVEALETAIREVPEIPRLVFLLRTREELSFKEIAGMIGVSEETARWHMLQARRALMERLDGWK